MRVGNMPIFLVAAAAWLAATATAMARPVDLELVLAVDCSGSINDDEFALQIKGYAAAFTHPAVLQAIRTGRHRSVAVTYVQWSGPFIQRQMVPWTAIEDDASAAEFADRMLAAPRAIRSGGTSLSGVIDYARTMFEANGFEGGRRVIDISGDGINNIGRLVQNARDEAVAAGIAINGLAILTEVGGLDNYFADNVIGGPGAFVIAVHDFDSFAAAILNKLVREIADAPAQAPSLAVGLPRAP
ncbi:MAG: DUF1194 domain-containing protein [Pseudomonadota bacterium]